MYGARRAGDSSGRTCSVDVRIATDGLRCWPAGLPGLSGGKTSERARDARRAAGRPASSDRTSFPDAQSGQQGGSRSSWCGKESARAASCFEAGMHCGISETPRCDAFTWRL